MSKVAAVVVGFMPEIAVLDSLLLSLLPQADVLIFVDNGGGASVLAHEHQARGALVYKDMGANKGLGAALNAGFAIATEAGAEYVVTFDQDSHADHDLLSRLHTMMTYCKTVDPAVVAISPAFFDRRDGKKITFPFYQSVNGMIRPVHTSVDPHGLVNADALITSGMFVDIRAWRGGVKYDEDMFVDFTDTEWCFRARNKGYSLYGCLNIEMGHALSDAPPVRVFGMSFFRYSPVRRYFFFRNTIAVCRMRHTPSCWKRRMLLALALRFFINLVIDVDRLQSFRMMLRGVRHGFSARLGPIH